jgi:hypothetical protein
LITFALGGQQRVALTNGDGRASATLQLISLPDNYEAKASFAGDVDFNSATDSHDVTVTKQNTTLVLNPATVEGSPSALSLMVATLTDVTGKPLREKTVFFILTGGPESASLPVITDFAGRARLGKLDLPAGTYQVAAYFSGDIPLSTGDTVSLPDPRYNPSSATGSLILVEPVCETVLEDFTSTNGSLGTNWAGARSKGHYRIVNNQVEVVDGGAAYWKPTEFGAEQIACLTVIQASSQGYHSLLMKVQDRNWQKGALAVFYDGTNQVVGIKSALPKKDWQIIATFPHQIQDGDQLAGKALADGTVQVYVNDRLIGQAQAGSFFANKGGFLGLWFVNVGDRFAIFDDFGGE